MVSQPLPMASPHTGKGRQPASAVSGDGEHLVIVERAMLFLGQPVSHMACYEATDGDQTNGLGRAKSHIPFRWGRAVLAPGLRLSTWVAA